MSLSKTTGQNQERIWEMRQDGVSRRKNSRGVVMPLKRGQCRSGIPDSRSSQSINTAYQNLWYTIKAVLREKFISINAYGKKLGKHQVNELTIHLKELEKQQQSSPKEMIFKVSSKNFCACLGLHQGVQRMKNREA